jgi:hypothetical protein
MSETIGQAEQPAMKIPGADELAARLADLGKRQFETFTKAQAQMFDALQDWNRDCLAIARAETLLASNAASKLMAARSIPELATAYQQWLTEQTDMLGENNKHFIADSQKLMEASWPFLSHDWSRKGPLT